MIGAILIAGATSGLRDNAIHREPQNGSPLPVEPFGSLRVHRHTFLFVIPNIKILFIRGITKDYKQRRQRLQRMTILSRKLLPRYVNSWLENDKRLERVGFQVESERNLAFRCGIRDTLHFSRIEKSGMPCSVARLNALNCRHFSSVVIRGRGRNILNIYYICILYCYNFQQLSMHNQLTHRTHAKHQLTRLYFSEFIQSVLSFEKSRIQLIIWLNFVSIKLHLPIILLKVLDDLSVF